MKVCDTMRALLITALICPLAALAQAPITYQGQLTESGLPHTGVVDMEFAFYNVPTGGAAELVVPQPGVSLNDGMFQVALDMDGLDLSQTWYLEPRVQGTSLTPRQRITAAPIALYALSGAGIGSYESVITVAKSGGHFASVADALASITGNSPSNPFLVWVGPGEYSETELVDIPAHVHVRGSGPEVTLITSDRSSSEPNQLAATVYLRDLARISDLSVENTGTGSLGYAIYSFLASRDAVIDNVTATASGSGTGGGRSGIHLRSSAPTINNSRFKGYGATGFGTAVNAGLTAVHTEAGGFPQALILNSTFLGGASSTVQNCTDNSGTGYGIQIDRSTPDIRNSHICGGYRSVALLQNGQVRIQHSELRVSSSSGAFMFEITASGFISVTHSALFLFNNSFKFTGAGTSLICIHNYATNHWLPVSNGTTADTACNQ